MDDLSDSPGFDAFGERLPAFRPRTAIGLGARRAGIAIFWSLALLIIAGRVYYAPSITPAPLELASR